MAYACLSSCHAAWPWHFLYLRPLPHGHGSLRPTFGSSRRTVLITSSPPVRAGRGPDPNGAGWAPAGAAPPGNGEAASGLFIVIGVARRGAGLGAAAACSFSTGRR